MRNIKHHTIITGHIRELVPQEYNPDIIKKTREAIDYALGETEPVALFRGLDPDVKFSFETFSGDGLKCTVYGRTGDPCIVFIIVRQANSIARKQYAELLKMDNGPQRAKSKMPEAPFCSVALTKHLEDARNREMLKWVGDYEGCAAVAWLYGDNLKETEVVEKTKERLWQWLMFGGDCVVDQEMIDILGKRYLIDFVRNAKKNIDSKANIPILKAGSAPMVERLEQLLKMIQ